MTVDEMILKRARYAGVTGGCGIATTVMAIGLLMAGATPLMAAASMLAGIGGIMWARGEMLALAAISARQAQNHAPGSSGAGHHPSV